MENVKRWIKAAGIRAIRTFCQTLVAMIPANIAIYNVSWWAAISVALTAATLSLLTSTYSLPEIDNKGDNENDN